MLKPGAIGSIVEIAKREQFPYAYLSRMIPFAFLAPIVMTVILNGRRSHPHQGAGAWQSQVSCPRTVVMDRRGANRHHRPRQAAILLAYFGW